jgi:hypothetical protein
MTIKNLIDMDDIYGSQILNLEEVELDGAEDDIVDLSKALRGLTQTSRTGVYHGAFGPSLGLLLHYCIRRRH